MTDIPIIFSASMVLALLREARKPGSGKTMTRRLLWLTRKFNLGSPRPVTNHMVAFKGRLAPIPASADEYCVLSSWAKVKPGDRLWVRENFTDSPVQWHGGPSSLVYAADWSKADREKVKGTHGVRWKPCIHMPRIFSRLTLIVAATKIERLRDISPFDARREGIAELRGGWFSGADGQSAPDAKSAFALLWSSLHGAASWEANPEVVALTFTVHETNIDAMPKAEAA